MDKSKELKVLDEIKDFLVGCKPPEPVETDEEYQQLSLIDACLDRLKDIEEEIENV
ncbi:hypothetical protein LA324_05185 [Corynebacterium coyleae]|uniref:hypothetical protein n=1 Tax=Corynebacterium coyleae TaxID=53374 RepID=UPI001CCAE6F0|nr:hypothetical protein [Corynebacterium coyleae]UBI10004.1 hypothetical protein LA324_05185 [Corynebacterium coyleae]